MTLIEHFELVSLFKRETTRLKEELLAFNYEEKMWETTGTITNSAGNLALHLIGNLNHFIGAELGATGYVRDRDAEFSSKNIQRALILQQLEATEKMLGEVLPKLDDEKILAMYPTPFSGKTVKTSLMLLHLLAHFNYHLGQINYLRRALQA